MSALSTVAAQLNKIVVLIQARAAREPVPAQIPTNRKRGEKAPDYLLRL
jgi:hypothetical protein